MTSLKDGEDVSRMHSSCHGQGHAGDRVREMEMEDHSSGPGGDRRARESRNTESRGLNASWSRGLLVS